MIEKIHEAVNVTLDPADNKEHYSKDGDQGQIHGEVRSWLAIKGLAR